jgi:hypothetical protein
VEECHEERRRIRRRLRNELKGATDMAMKEYFESIFDESVKYHRAGFYDLMFMKTKQLSWKGNRRIQNIASEHYKRNIIVEERQVLKIWGNYIA